MVTGAGSGIGRALSLALARRGARLALSDVDEPSLIATAAGAAACGAEVEHYRVNVADRGAVFAHADAVAARFGAVNLVVNNAGVGLSATVRDSPIEDIEWLMGIDFWGVIYGCKAFLPRLIESGDGHLVNISSVLGLIAVPELSAYCAAKFAVRGFTEALRQELLIAGDPVAVSCVHPGGVKTGIARATRSADKTPDELADQFAKVAFRTPEKAAAIILRGVERDRARILVGIDAHLIDALQRLLGSRYQALAARAAARV